MGIAYRALKRSKPIMDGFAFHPYGENSSTPPTVEHLQLDGRSASPTTTSSSHCSAQAFDGTEQLGSKLPILYDEYGVDSQIPVGEARVLRRGASSSKPVSESVQATYYRQALQMAACQPTVRGFLIFHVTDETTTTAGSPALYFPDGTPKSSRAVVKQTMTEIRTGGAATV